MRFHPHPALPTIRRQLVLLVLTCALPAAIGFALLIHHFYARERTQIQNDSLLTARALIHAVDRDLNNGIVVALALASSPSLTQHDLPTFHAQAKSVLRDVFPGFNFVLSDSNANQLINTVRPFGAPIPDPDALKRIRAVFETGKPTISDLFVGTVTRQAMAAIQVPVWRGDIVAYCLSVGFTTDRIGKILAEQRLPPNRYVAIIDAQGVVIARSHDPGRYIGQKAAPTLLDHMKLKDEDAIEATTLEGVPVYSMYSRSPASGWTVVIGVPRRAMLDELLASIAWVSWMVLGLLAAGFGVAWFLGGRISRSVRDLSTTAIALGSGAAVSVAPASFREANEAALTLHKVEQELQAHRHHLVGLIDERTSQLQAANEQLTMARDTAEAANRAKGDFVANMSHELRTPMNAVLGMAHLLGASPLAPEQRRYLEMIQVSGKSLLGVLNDILDFSKIEAGKLELSPTRFNLDQVLHALAAIMSVNAGDKDLELAIGVEPDVPRQLYGDALRLQQVLINLTGNAIKFTARGEVSVLVERSARQLDKVELRFTIRDTGIGISEQQQAKLFSPFTQADSSTTRRFGGTGLGLAISKRLMEALGGSIDLRSTPGQGSEFRVSVPLLLADDQDETARHAALRARLPGRLRLLVVDDNATSRAYLAKAIEGWQWQADCAASGSEALARIRALHAQGMRYDLALVDWQMPEMDGLATLRAIRALPSDAAMPVVLMASTAGRDRLVQEHALAGAPALLNKPVTASSLFDVVHETLVQHGATVSAVAPSPSPRLNARLLLVEDNAMNQRVAKGILEHAGATVDVADNGQIAFDMLRDGDTEYDLILMDVQMPVMDGFHSTRLIREELHLSLPILAMTAGVMESEREQCIASGMDDFIGKPLDIEQMFATINRHLLEYAARR